MVGSGGHKSLTMVVFLFSPHLFLERTSVAMVRPLAAAGGAAGNGQTDQALPTVDVNMAT